MRRDEEIMQASFKILVNAVASAGPTASAAGKLSAIANCNIDLPLWATCSNCIVLDG